MIYIDIKLENFKDEIEKNMINYWIGYLSIFINLMLFLNFYDKKIN